MSAIWKWGKLALASGALLGLVAAGYFSLILTTDRQLLESAQEALKRNDFHRAEQLCQQVLARSPGSTMALTLAASAADRDGRKEAALCYLESIPDLDGDTSAESIERQLRCGELAIELGKVSLAESKFRQTLLLVPEHESAIRKLCFLLRIEGRNWEAQEFLQRLADLDKFGPDDLFLLGSKEWMWLDAREAQYLDYCHRLSPPDLVNGLGRIRQALLREELHPAMEQLSALIIMFPDVLEAQARLGTILVQESRDAEFLDWNHRLNPAASRHPGIWFARGLWLRKRGSFREAIRCFGESVLRDPNHRGACTQLSQLLLERDDEASTIFAKRATRLVDVEDLLREVQQSPDRLQGLVEALTDLGRDWEASAWQKLSATKSVERPGIHVPQGQMPQHQVDAGTARIRFNESFIDVDWSQYLLPDWTHFDSINETPDIEVPQVTSSISFVDVASKVGLEFRYDNGSGLAAGRAFVFEFSGGGVAVVDYDADGWPDLYLTQGGKHPATSNQKRSTDKLFRNLGNGHFADTTQCTDVGNHQYGQGVTVGDYDNDGFPDLFVANIGANLFFRNQGDGTFADVTADTGTAGNEWSLSAAIADLNGDTFPDLYVVNYLAGANLFTRSCEANGRPVQCPPGAFLPEQDRIYLNLGDGRFREITDESGIRRSDGKGMGIVVADFGESGRPQIFIANDTTANDLFVNERLDSTGIPVFVDRGIAMGLAFNELGNARSSMGIACGDANADGYLDLLITNYIRESSSFLVQRNDHTFEDRTRHAGLREPSHNKMGWGAQFLDADLDGRLDLAVANGHLDDYSANRIPYKMVTQVFRNLGGGRFEELSSSRLGPYFSQPVLGRAIARLDWNRDGRDDFCVTHVDVPFALLSNTTVASGQSLILSLRGVTSSRDAIGSVLRIQVGDQTLVRQLVAGDGFEASNERKIVVGLGTETSAACVGVHWPSGATQEFLNLTTDREWILTEGNSMPVSLSRH